MTDLTLTEQVSRFENDTNLMITNLQGLTVFLDDALVNNGGTKSTRTRASRVR